MNFETLVGCGTMHTIFRVVGAHFFINFDNCQIKRRHIRENSAFKATAMRTSQFTLELLNAALIPPDSPQEVLTASPDYPAFRAANAITDEAGGSWPQLSSKLGHNLDPNPVFKLLPYLNRGLL